MRVTNIFKSKWRLAVLILTKSHFCLVGNYQIEGLVRVGKNSSRIIFRLQIISYRTFIFSSQCYV